MAGHLVTVFAALAVFATCFALSYRRRARIASKIAPEYVREYVHQLPDTPIPAVAANDVIDSIVATRAPFFGLTGREAIAVLILGAKAIALAMMI